MLSPLRNRFGIPGAISVVALVFAMLGGAYAASSDSGSGKATASTKAKKGPRGPRGPAGPAGPAGPQGPAGAAGAKGDTGAAGANGKDGADGTAGDDGKSVEAESASLAECPEGGTRFKVNGVIVGKACNGDEGPEGPPGQDGATGSTGPEGSPWTAGGVLPEGKTETGTYLISSESGTGTFAGFALTSISFPVPLAEPLAEANAIVVPSTGGVPTECENADDPGTASIEKPEADPGFLCIFQGVNVNMEETTFLNVGTQTSGVTIAANPSAAEAYEEGTWAVTAPIVP